ncbi:hypothetical protein GC169_11960 [bacterium]|nr:hypothetical protein [bacterium]
MTRLLSWRSVVGLAALALLSTPLAATADARWWPSDGEKLSFKVLRNGQPFGGHVVAFQVRGDELVVETGVDLKAKIGPITAYHYAQTSREVWKDRKLLSLDARTKRGGKWYEVSARATLEGVRIAGSAFKGMAPADIIPSSHWNIDQFRSRKMLSTESGELIPVVVEDLGTEMVKVGAREVRAQKFLLDADIDALFWFDEAGRWVKCAFNADGQKIEYVLADTPSPVGAD